MSLIRAFKYLWEGEPSNDPTQETVILGAKYPPCEQWAPDLLDDVRTRIWFMYRTNFQMIPRHPDGPSPLQLMTMLRGGPIDPNGFSSDIGWGCMIRTGQCLVANGLLLLDQGREWRLPTADTPLDLVRAFADTPSAPLSIHNFVAQGIPRGKLPGQWFGPSTVAGCIKTLVPSLSTKLAVYVSEGSDIYLDSLLSLKWPVLVLCPIRLGINEINATYFDGVKACLDVVQSVGIAGGRTSASHYFYGYQGDVMLFHDPHSPKQALDLENPSYETVHSDQLRGLHLNEMDPSMLCGFLLKDRRDFEDWKENMSKVPVKSQVIVFSEKRPDAFTGEDEVDEVDEVDGFVVCEEEGRKEDEVLVAPPQVEEECAVFV